MGLLDEIEEKSRQRSESDEQFWKNLVMFFELRVPASLVASTPNVTPAFLFPLVVAPESYSMDEEFGVELTNTQMGGIYAEESGIYRRKIHIAGTTGFWPKFAFGGGGYGQTSLAARAPSDRTWGRSLRSVTLGKLSGQRHFHYLQDAVFRMYGDLVRDPATALETQLLFHNLKDEESWLVVPMTFRLTRDKGDRFLYRYEIEMLVLAKAELTRMWVSEDAGLIDEMQNIAQSIRDAIGVAQGVFDELTAVGQELENIVADYQGIIGSVSSVIDAAQDFVDGVTDLINIPFTTVMQTVDLIDNALITLFDVEEAGQSAYTLPLHTVMKFRTLADSLERLGVYPSQFRQPLDRAIADLRGNENPYQGLSDAQVQEQTNAVTPQTLSEVRDLGTTATTGDVASAQAKGRAGQEVKRYTSGIYRSVRAGDTLASLAARYLGDARLWVYIAAANGLRPPFLTDQAGADLARADSPFQGALSIGDRILIPDFSRAPEKLPVTPVLGVRPEEPAEVRVMGRDLKMVQVAGRGGASLYDVPLATETGSSDAELIEGLANLSQALLLRARIEKGTDQLYRDVGLAGIIGTKNTEIDLTMSKLKIIESLSQDARVAQVRDVSLLSTGDSLAIEATIEPRNWDSGERIRLVP